MKGTKTKDRITEQQKTALSMVQRNGLKLETLSEELKTEEICLAAVNNDGYALEYVPDEYKTNTRRQRCQRA